MREVVGPELAAIGATSAGSWTTNLNASRSRANLGSLEVRRPGRPGCVGSACWCAAASPRALAGHGRPGGRTAHLGARLLDVDADHARQLSRERVDL